jgi:hypothetical protein
VIHESYEQWAERQTRETQLADQRWKEGRFGEREPVRFPRPSPLDDAHRQALQAEAVRYYRAREIEWVKRFGRGVWCAKVGRFDYFEMPQAHARDCDCDQGEKELALYPMTEEHRRSANEALATWRRWSRATSDAE